MWSSSEAKLIILATVLSLCSAQFVIREEEDEPERAESCHLPTGKPSLCVPVNRCKYVQSLIGGLQKPLASDVALLIRDSFQCLNRNSPDTFNVCCPLPGIEPPTTQRPLLRDIGRCVLSGRGSSSCTSFNSCSPFVQLLQNLKRPLSPDIPSLMQSSWVCGRDEERRPKVCCPDEAIITTTTAASTTPEPTTTTPEPTTTTTVEEITTTEPETVTLSEIELELARFNAHPNRGALAPFDSCGHPGVFSRIVGGQTAALGQFPWLANVGYRFRKNADVLYRCGAVLIGPRYILTAAHCVTRLPRGFKPDTIRIGEHDFSKEEDCDEESGIKICSEPPQDFEIEKIIPHPEYGKAPHNLHDIALVRLSRPAEENDFVTPICLPYDHGKDENYETSGSDIAIHSLYTVAGWGATTRRGRNPAEVLQYLDVSIFNSTKCEEVFKKRSSSVTPGNQICAGGELGKDSCSGDSGSSLMQEFMMQYTAVGVVSFGPKLCGTEGVPGVYTRVRNYMDWILDNVEVD